MAYHIQYGSIQHDKKVYRRKQSAMWGVIIVLLALVMASACFPQEMSSIREAVFPFLKPQVKEAFGEMVAQIRDGTSAYEAAGTFCREIVFENTY